MADEIHLLVTGGSGQVGRELARANWPSNVVLHLPTRSEMCLEDPASVSAVFEAMPFSAVINAGAYTAVDKAEDEVATAFGANAMGPAILADLTRRAGIPIIHVSTDYVFGGSLDRPYEEDDPVGPLGVYGASKLSGELAVLTGNPRSVVIRTAWVLSSHRANFLKTMLRLAETRSVVRVVSDQTGCPTSARDIAEALSLITMRMVAQPQAPYGVYHFVNAGETTWAGLARELFALSHARQGPTATVEEITTAEFPTAARRPANSRLAWAKIHRDYGIQPRPWRVPLAEILSELYPGLAEGDSV